MLRTTFENKKDLIKAVCEFTGQTAKYLGAPTFAYAVGEYTIDRYGSIISNSEMGELKNYLIEKGFIQGSMSAEGELVENKEIQPDFIRFSIPLEGADKRSIINFANMLYSKQYLINRALGMAVLSIHDSFLKELEDKELSEITNDEYSGFKVKDDSLEFIYPDTNGSEKLKAYMTLMCMAFAKAKECTRVQAKLVHPENEKYYMRVWLIRIGLGGKGGAETRKVLLKDLNGHTAFRTKEEMEMAKEKYRLKKSEKQQ